MDGLEINLKDLESDQFVSHVQKELFRVFDGPIPGSQEPAGKLDSLAALYDQTILCACSGGPDSTALVIALAALQARMGFRLVLIHVNHNLRGQESHADADFCQRLANELGIGAVIESVEPHGHAEEELRQLRYACINRVLKAQAAKFVFMGHTLDDQAETVLLRLFRGTGPGGVTAMRSRSPLPVAAGFIAASSEEIIRPLLTTRRLIVHEFLARHEIASRTDSSNLDDAYARNFIRNKIIPALEERFPGLILNIERFRSLMQDQEADLEILTSSAWQELLSDCDSIALLDSDEGETLAVHTGIAADTGANELQVDSRLCHSIWSRPAFQALPEFLQGRVLLQQLRQLKVEPSYENIARLKEIIGAGAGGSSLNENLAVLVKNERIYWRNCLNAMPVDVLSGFSYELRINSMTVIPELDLAISFQRRVLHPGSLQGFPPENALCAFVATELCNEVLTVRLREPGDWLQPFGMSEPVRLKKFLHTHNDRPGLTRGGRQVVVTKGDQVLWVPGVGLAEPCRVKNSEYGEIKFVQLYAAGELFC